MAWTCGGRTNTELVANLCAANLIRSPRVKAAFLQTDRALFIPSRLHPYEDAPQPVGDGATVSAPHMHAHAVETLLPNLVEGASVLDVGCGTGYLLSVFHALVGSSGCVLGIDHCPRLVSVAHTALARSPTTLSALRDRPGILNAQTADGRKGAPEGMTPEGGWNVIHVGAAVGTWEQVEVLERQLARDGLMFVPVGEAGRQAVWLIKKGDHGECERERLFGVRYIPLTDVESQRRA